MKNIFLEMWKQAKPYYEKGRPMDIDHIEWMMKEAEAVCKQERLDEEILMPVVIIHDVGYAQAPDKNPFNSDIRRLHMAASAEIASKILKELNYPPGKTKRILHYISVHDNWAFGDDKIYHEDKMLGVFNDLDYMWVVTPKGFPALCKILNLQPREMLKWVEKNDKPARRPFCTPTTKRLYEKYLSDRKKELE